MIATRESTTSRKDIELFSLEKTKVQDDSLSFYAGLSFPEVPTTKIVVKKPVKEIATEEEQESLMAYVPVVEASKQPEMSITDEELLESAGESVGLLAKDRQQEKYIAPETKSLMENSSAITVSTASVPKARSSLESLYAKEILFSDSTTYSYPELPSISRQNLIATAPMTMSAPPPTQPVQTMQTQPPQILSSTILTPETTNPLMQGKTQTQEVKRPDDSLVNDLLQENSRLSNELDRLRRELSQSETKKSANSIKRSSTTTGSSTASKASSTATATTTAPEARIAGLKVSDVTQKPSVGMKYVCCGACGQWLLAPKDAIFVVCSCEAVNNCSLTPQREQEQEETQNNSRWPWFLECLKVPFS